MVAPGDPERAAALAGAAGRVSHDGEAVYAAQALAAMEALAFVERDLENLFAAAARLIPSDCVILRMTREVREWSAADRDWEKTFARIQKSYGYDRYGGGCHTVPNHAVIVLALACGGDGFQESLRIANTAGWDTDCNSGNVGCLLGIKNGLAGLEAGPDWRGPVADQIFLPTADGGRCITDAVRETYALCRAGRALAGESAAEPKDGARFHFELPGAVQGFRFEESPECRCVGTLWNTAGHSRGGQRSLAIGYAHLAPGRVARVATPTFITPESAEMSAYALLASPTLYPGQTLRARLEAGAQNQGQVLVLPFVRHYGEGDAKVFLRGPAARLGPGQETMVSWRLPGTGGQPIFEVGVEVAGAGRADGSVYLDYLTWDGAPEVCWERPAGTGSCWQKAWVNAADRFWFGAPPREYQIAQNEGAGLAIQGTREWSDYTFHATVLPHMTPAAGIAVCVQGLKRYLALLLTRGNRIQLVREYYGRTVLAEARFPWTFDKPVELSLQTQGTHLRATAGGKQIFEVHDETAGLASGAVALLCEEGRCDFGSVKIAPAASRA